MGTGHWAGEGNLDEGNLDEGTDSFIYSKLVYTFEIPNKQ